MPECRNSCSADLHRYFNLVGYYGTGAVCLASTEGSQRPILVNEIIRYPTLYQPIAKQKQVGSATEYACSLDWVKYRHAHIAL